MRLAGAAPGPRVFVSLLGLGVRFHAPFFFVRDFVTSQPDVPLARMLHYNLDLYQIVVCGSAYASCGHAGAVMLPVNDQRKKYFQTKR